MRLVEQSLDPRSAMLAGGQHHRNALPKAAAKSLAPLVAKRVPMVIRSFKNEERGASWFAEGSWLEEFIKVPSLLCKAFGGHVRFLQRQTLPVPGLLATSVTTTDALLLASAEAAFSFNAIQPQPATYEPNNLKNAQCTSPCLCRAIVRRPMPCTETPSVSGRSPLTPSCGDSSDSHNICASGSSQRLTWLAHSARSSHSSKGAGKQHRHGQT